MQVQSFPISEMVYIQLQNPPPTPPNQVIHALQILYSAVREVLSRFLQTKKQVKSEILHLNGFCIYSKSTF